MCLSLYLLLFYGAASPQFFLGEFLRKERPGRVLKDSVRNSGGSWTGLRISVVWFKKEIVYIRLRRV